MTTTPPALDHPVLACTGRIAAALDEAMASDPVLMTTAAKATALVELSRVTSRLQGLVLRVLAHADDVALDAGARSPASWLAHHTRGGRGAAASALALAESLEETWHGVREGLLLGRVNLDQARIIARALDELPDDLDPEILARAEAHLVAEAAHFDPHQLRILGRKVLEVVAPDVAEDEERKKLEDEERRARRATQLTMRRRGDGTTDISIRVSDAVAGRLKTYLDAYAAPRRDHLEPDGERTDPETGRRVPYSVRLGRAFCALLESMPGERLPRHGGSATTVVVTIDLDDLRRQIGVARLDTDDRISAAEAMRLACSAKIVPLVLGGQGQPLHLGRARRFFDDRQRLAMAVRDQHCRAEGCDIPATWCEAHHRGDPWSRGGRTDLEEGVLLCSWHHHRAHDTDFLVSHLPNGDVRYRRRT